MRRCESSFYTAWNWRGRGMVKDAYNPLADGIWQLLRTLARVQKMELTTWDAGQGYARYLAASLKGTVEIDWDVPTARRAFLTRVFRTTVQ